MKKVLALLLAAATTMSLGMTVLADDPSVSEGEISSSEATSSEAPSSEATSSEDATPVGEPTALIFGADAEGAILGETLLEPGTEYKFPVSVQYGDVTKALDEALLKDYKFTYSKVSSNSAKTFKIDEYKGVYYLNVEIKEGTPTKEIDVKYNVKLVRKSNNLSVFTQEVKFSYGYEETNSDYLNDLDKGDAVEIDNSKPVITKSQFEKIAKINDYKNVDLQGSDWKINVNVTDETTKNFVFSNAGIKEILAKFNEQEFKFYNFAGKPSFAATGRVSLDVSDIIEDFDKLYTYRYADGKLYRLNATYNEEDETLEFRTRVLDNFVVTDKLIEDGTVVVEGSTNTGSDDSNGGKTNPSTGASDMVNVAVMAAIASLAIGGVAAMKKASK